MQELEALEQRIAIFLARLVEAYTNFFFHYVESPLLVVNVAEIDFVNRSEDLKDLLQQVMRPPAGTRYYRPIQAQPASP